MKAGPHHPPIPFWMSLLLAGAIFGLLLPGCGGSPPAAQNPSSFASASSASSDVIDSSPRGSLVFLGVSSVRSRMEESIDLALEDAARRLAIYRQVEGEFSSLSVTGGRIFDYRAETTSTLIVNESYRDLVDELDFNKDSDVFTSNNAVFVRTRYPGRLSLNHRPTPPGTKPAWIDNPPSKIGDYTAGVGSAGYRNFHRDAVIASYEDAIFSVMRNFFATTRGETTDYTGVGFLSQGGITEVGVEAGGILYGFYVLETWTDPSNKSVWTLAVADRMIPKERIPASETVPEIPYLIDAIIEDHTDPAGDDEAMPDDEELYADQSSPPFDVYYLEQTVPEDDEFFVDQSFPESDEVEMNEGALEAEGFQW